MSEQVKQVNHSKELLDWGVKERAEIKEGTDRLNLRMKNVNSAIMGVMTRLGLKSYQHELGILTWRDGSTTHGIDKQKLVAALLSTGLSAEKVASVMEAADKPGARPAVVSFTPYKGPEDGGS